MKASHFPYFANAWQLHIPSCIINSSSHEENPLKGKSSISKIFSESRSMVRSGRTGHMKIIPEVRCWNLLSADVISTLQETRMFVRCRAPGIVISFRNQGGNAEPVSVPQSRDGFFYFQSLLYREFCRKKGLLWKVILNILPERLCLRRPSA